MLLLLIQKELKVYKHSGCQKFHAKYHLWSNENLHIVTTILILIVLKAG